MSLTSDPLSIALQQAIAHHQRGRLKEAEQMYRVVLKIHPGHHDAGRNLLASMFMSGRYADMEQAAQELVKDAPRFGVAWKGMGLAQLMQGKDAVHAFRMAATFLPDDAESHENLGLSLKRAGKLDEAAHCFGRAIEISPTSASAHVNLGNLLKETGRSAEAEAAYRRALALRPDLAQAHHNLAAVLHDLGRTDEAQAHAGRAQELSGHGSSPDVAA